MEKWKSRWGLIFAAMGAAIGTGNIWRFPKEAAANGGGAFMIAWMIFLFTWSIPLLIAEFSIGKKTGLGTIGSFKVFAGKKYAFMGAWMLVVSTVIGFYYAVVMGWVIRYFTFAASGSLSPGADTSALWGNFISSPFELIFFQIVAIVVSAYVVYRGIAKGIEVVNKILIPALFILLLVAAVWALCLPGAINGLKFLFIPRMEYLGRSETWISALAQSAWSCSAGMGMAITYAVYMRRKDDTALNAFITGFGNNAVSLIAGIAVICTVFALSSTPSVAMGTMESESISLTFVHLTRLFTLMPGGIFVAAIFFLAMSFAALTSMISGFEIAVRNFMDHGWSRHKSLAFITIITFLLGIPSAVIVSGNTPVFLSNQDHVWGMGLIISGLFVAFAVWKYGVSRFRNELINTGYNDIRIGVWWDFVIIILFPLQFIILMLWYFHQSISTHPDTWFNPLEPTGFATVVVQWILVIIALILLNNWIGKKIIK